MIIFILLFLFLNQTHLESSSSKTPEEKSSEEETNDQSRLNEVAEKERLQGLFSERANIFISLAQEKLILNFDNHQLTRNYLFLNKLSSALNYFESHENEEQKAKLETIRNNFFNKLSEVKNIEWEMTGFEKDINTTSSMFNLIYKTIGFNDFFVKNYIKGQTDTSQEVIIRNTKIWDSFFKVISIGPKNKILKIPFEKENQKVVLCIEDSASFFEDKITQLSSWKDSTMQELNPDNPGINYFEAYFYYYGISYFSRQGFDSYIKEIINLYDILNKTTSEETSSPQETKKDDHLLYLDSFSFNHLEKEYSSEWLYKMKKDIINIGKKNWQLYIDRYKSPVSRQKYLNDYMADLFKNSFYKAPVVEEKTENSNLCYFFHFQQSSLQSFYNAFDEMINNLELSNF